MGEISNNNKSARILIMILGLLLLSFSLFGTEVHAQDVKVGEWIETKQQSAVDVIENAMKSAPTKSFEKDFLWLHNNGEPIETNIISGETDFYLEAVSKDIVNGIEVIDYYFNQVDNTDRTLTDIETTVNNRNEEVLFNNELNSLISTDISTLAVANVANPVIRNFNWTFNSSAHYLTTTVEMSRKSSTATINGTQGSVWDVITNSQYERKTGLRYLENFYTRLAIPYTYQTLLDWGPSSTSSGTVAVSLSGAGVPGISYSFATGALYNTKDLSSKSSKYGRWNFSRTVLPIYANKLTTRPAIRASNTSGNFALELSHSLDFDNVTNNTGVITITTPDR